DVRGFMVYELNKTSLELLNLAVRADCRRQGVAMAMLKKLRSKLSAQRRRRIDATVRESNLPALETFKAAGYMAVEILRDWYDDTTEDGIVMRYHLPLDDCL